MTFIELKKSRGPKNGFMKKHVYSCDFCKKVFESCVKKTKYHFCSNSCRTKLKTQQCTVNCICEVCGKQWASLKSLATRTCSRKCGIKINTAASKNPAKWHNVTCENCGKSFERRKRRQSKHIFCSHNCKSMGAHIWLKDVKKTSRSNTKTGYYVTIDGRKYHYDSSYELRRMKELDYREKDIVFWKRCDFSIPWIDREENLHHYHPDFFVERADGSLTVEETKGRMTDDDVRKMKSALEFVKQKNWKYKIIQYDNPPELPLPKMNVYHNDYGTFIRPSEESIFMSMAATIAARSTCLRKKVCAVFTDESMQRVLCFGYNGNVSGGDNQCDSLLPGSCGCIHAEINALTKSVTSLVGSTCFVTLSPCFSCAKVLINRGIKRIVYYETYRNASGLELCRKHGIDVVKYDSVTEITSCDNPMMIENLPFTRS